MPDTSSSLPGNPFAEQAERDPGSNLCGVNAALLALAHELRTANLIAANDPPNGEVRERLGLPAKPPNVVRGF